MFLTSWLALGCLVRQSVAEADGVVLLDAEDLLPGPGASQDYVGFAFEVQSGEKWVHIEIESDDAEELYGTLAAPFESCWLQIPSWHWQTTHTNEGFVWLADSGTHNLYVYGESPVGGAMVRVTVTALDDEDLPIDANTECVLGADPCACVEACNCGENP